MICENCNTKLTESDMSVYFAAHDENLLEVSITCPKCQLNHYLFAPIHDLTIEE